MVSIHPYAVAKLLLTNALRSATVVHIQPNITALGGRFTTVSGQVQNFSVVRFVGNGL